MCGATSSTGGTPTARSAPSRSAWTPMEVVASWLKGGLCAPQRRGVLPGPPPRSLATFEGHRWAWRSAKDTLERRSALVTGCSVWHKQRKLGWNAEAPVCLCGFPLGRTCCGTALRHGIWWRACGLRPTGFRSGCWRALDPDHLLESLVEALEVKLAPGVPVFVATNNSLVDTVAAWAVALDGDQAFSQTVARQHRLVALQRCYSPVVRCT